MNEPLNLESSSFWGRSLVRIVFLCGIATSLLVDPAKFIENCRPSMDHLNRCKISLLKRSTFWILSRTRSIVARNLSTSKLRCFLQHVRNFGIIESAGKWFEHFVSYIPAVLESVTIRSWDTITVTNQSRLHSHSCVIIAHVFCISTYRSRSFSQSVQAQIKAIIFYQDKNSCWEYAVNDRVLNFT